MSENKMPVQDTGAGGKTKNQIEGKKNEKKQGETAKAKPVIYLGPDIKGIANHCDVFSDGCGPRLAKICEEIPILRSLCVPLKDAGEKFVQLKTGGIFSKLYQAALEQLEKGAENE